MNIIYMGTPDFAVPCLEKLIEANHCVKAVFTQPDKPVGRKQILTPPDVKICAEKYSIPVYQPDSLKNQDVIDLVSDIDADIIVVVAYGKLLPKDILFSKKYGSINVHASLLPKYRGASPIQCAIINGDDKTGVSIMQMDEGLDTGDILYVSETDIDIDETAAQLFDRLSVIGANSLVEALDKIENNQILPIKQDENNASVVKKITKEMSIIDWNKSALEIHNKVRGMQTWPCAKTTIDGKAFKIHKTKLIDEKYDTSGVVVSSDNKLIISCGDGNCIEVLELQQEGKKRMDVKSFLLGNKLAVGTILGG